MISNLALLIDLFSDYPEIKLVYLFGSQAREEAGPMSDFDFGVYLDPAADLSRQKDILLELMVEISAILKENQIDLVLLNQAISPLLKFNIIKEGKLIYQKQPYRLMVEPSILNEYFDFNVFMEQYEK